MKTLVAIANFGTKNVRYLNMLLEEYRSMTNYQVDIVVLSNIPKDLGSDIEVVVGLPTRNPWSLPFGHKRLFAERIQNYSEDDTLINERNIDAFVKITQLLPDEKIAGYIRYEISNDGKKYYSTIHSHYHWDPNSVITIGEYTFILTQRQLRKAINSGGFILPPREGRYDMLVTAATDPYTQCGMKKLVCISHIDDFCLHHLPNVYCGKIGVDAESANLEIEKLKTLGMNDTISCPLLDPTTNLDDGTWDKKYYEPARDDILSLVPNEVTRVLSVGCGSGSTESELIKQGVEVVGIPLDCVIQASAEAKGIKVLPPNFDMAWEYIQDERFDCILFSDVLQYISDPVSVIQRFLPLLGKNGSVIFSVPNFNHPSVWRKRIHGRFPLPEINPRCSFEKFKLHFTTRRMMYKWLKACGLTVTRSYRSANLGDSFIDNLNLKRLKEKFPRIIVVLSEQESS
jgi:2-polyprenyl-3-methyl-5-hydroxy-6-metoxy-1,4-benzoquinol methylase